MISDLLIVDEKISKEKYIFFGFLKLNKEISALNYISSILHYPLMVFSFMSIESRQPLLFTSPKFFNYSKGKAASLSATILLIDLILRVLLTPIFGIIMDKIGRKALFFSGVILVSISMAIIPLMTTVFPGYLICRLVFLLGIIPLLSAPFLGDYVHDDYKGRGAGIIILFSQLGGILVNFMNKYLLKEYFGLKSNYFLSAGIILFFGMLLSFGIKGGTKYIAVANEVETVELIKLRTEEENNPEIKKNFRYLIKITIHSFRNNWILIGFLIAFLSKGNSQLSSIFLSLWCENFYPNTKEGKNSAFSDSQTLSIIGTASSILISIIFSFLLEKKKYRISIFITFFFSISGIVVFLYLKQTIYWLSIISMILIGFGSCGFLMEIDYFVQKYSLKMHRAYVNSFSGTITTIGLFFVSVLGGYLFDHWNINAPYIIFLIMELFCLFVISIIIIRNKFPKTISIE